MKNSVKKRLSDDRICDECYSRNSSSPSSVGVSDNVCNVTPTLSDESSTGQSAASVSLELQCCKQEILILRQTVNKLQDQVSFLLSFVRAVDSSPTAFDGDLTDGCSETIASEKVTDSQCITLNKQPTSTRQVLMFHYVMLLLLQ